MCGVCLVAFAGTGTARAAWQELTHFLTLQGRPEPASANVLSEHEIEVLDGMSPQHQAELLLERSINHYRGANEQIAARVGRWRGGLTLDDRLQNLFSTALNSGDLRVRAAAIEVNIVARGLEKAASTIDRLEPDARQESRDRARTRYGTSGCLAIAESSRRVRLRSCWGLCRTTT